MNAFVKDPIEWIDVGAVTDIPLRGARRVPTPKGDVAVFRTGDDRLYALKDRCPHKAGPISQGIVHGHAVAGRHASRAADGHVGDCADVGPFEGIEDDGCHADASSSRRLSGLNSWASRPATRSAQGSTRKKRCE